MKADLIAEEMFTVKVGNHMTERMRVVSRWNGLMELRTDKGDKLIVSEPLGSDLSGVFDTIFNGLFRTAEETKAAGTQIIMGSPSLLARLKQAEAEAAPPPPPSPPPARQVYEDPRPTR